MDYLFNELHHIYTQHKKALQGRLNEVLALCEEADHLRGEINVTHEHDEPPTAQIEGVLAEAALEFPQKARTLHQAEQAEKAFCTTHNLIDKNINPNALISFLLMAICVFADAAVNSSFLYNAHMVSGPFAALLISFLISLTNVVTCACAGYFIGRFLHYGNNSTDPDAPEFKTIRDRAKWQFKVFIGVMGLFLLTIGLVRSTESLDRIGHSLAHYHEFLVTPEAIFLVLLNICIAVFSYHKGRSGFVHPYGNYSKYQQAVIAAREDLHGTYAEYIEEIEDICVTAQDASKAQDKAQAKSIERYNKKVTQCHNAQRELEQATYTAQSGFTAAATKLVNTLSVISGKSESISGDVLEQFSFDDITVPDLPDFYQSPKNDRRNKAALATARKDALERLSEAFKHVTQS